MTGPARFEAQVSLQFFDRQIESSKSLANRKGQMSHMTPQPEKAGKSWEKPSACLWPMTCCVARVVSWCHLETRRAVEEDDTAVTGVMKNFENFDQF